MAITPQDLVSEVSDKIGKFTNELPNLSNDAFKSIQSLLKELKVDASGNIKVSVENLRLINKIQLKFENNILTDSYLSQVDDLKTSFNDITELQTKYFNNVFTDFAAPEVIAELENISINSTIGSLSEFAINENIVKGVTDLLEQNITSGANFMDLQDSLKEFIIGNDKIDSKLASYSKQILTDSMSQYTANYQKIVTDDLGLKWYQYVGPLVTSSRPLCDSLVKKRYVHKSELGEISRGVVDGKNVGKAGMISGTNASNFQVYRGGYNCNHLLTPISERAVPKEIRIELYKKENIKYDANGLAINQ